jgi:pimeloyl-ACP methyl ester carboxylesterase
MTGTSSNERLGVYQAAEWQVEIASSWRPARRQMPVLWFHGFGIGGQVARRGSPPTLPGWVYYDALSLIARRLGTVVLSADYGGINTWANDTAITRANTMLTWAANTANLGVRSDRVIVAGESMGTLLALNWAWRNPTKVAAIWLRGPIVRMQEFHDLNPGLGAFMEAAYTNLAGLIAAYPTHDPVQNMGELVQLGPVTRLDYTDGDEFIPATWAPVYAAQTHALARLHPGRHEDNTRFDHTEVADWLADTTRTAA